jgi:hypothetical protein
MQFSAESKIRSKQIACLERTATEMSRAGAGHWAVDQLCDRGSLGSLVVIQKAIGSRRNGQRDEDEITFCEARIRVLYGKQDRAKALGAVLNVGSSAENSRLTAWAIQKLSLMHSAEADAELRRFVNEIDGLTADSPSKTRLLTFRPMIETAPRAPAK